MERRGCSFVEGAQMSDFVDYYELMQISPRAEVDTIRRVYRMLAGRYHPDNRETGNLDMFIQLKEAYAVLTDPEKRAAYDARLMQREAEVDPVFELKDFVVGVEAEANRRLGILCLLYNKRRTSPDQHGMSIFDLEKRTGIPREHLEFCIWYLSEKGYIRADENTNDLSLTVAGADFVEEQSRESHIAYRLLKRSPLDRAAADAAGSSSSGS
jgi:curved DNA-binding protein